MKPLSDELLGKGDKKVNPRGEQGVAWLWFVDPEARVLEAYRNDAGIWRPAGSWQGPDQVSALPFDTITWPLPALWG